MEIPIVVQPRRVPRDISGTCTIRLQSPYGAIWKTYESDAAAAAEAAKLGLLRPRQAGEAGLSASRMLHDRFVLVEEAKLTMEALRSAGFR